MLTSRFTRPIATARPQTTWHIAIAALLVLASDAVAAPQLPARVVVLDERSPHVELVAAVRDAFADELAAVAGATESSPAETSSNAGKDQSPEGVLKRLTSEVIAGTLELPDAATPLSSLSDDEPYINDPLVAAVAGELDLEAGAFMPANEGATLAIGQIRPGSSLAFLPPEAREGSCIMPALMIYPSVDDIAGRPVRRPRAAWGLDTALCRYFVPTKREARQAKLYKSKVEERGVRKGLGAFFTGAEPAPDEPEDEAATAASGWTFTGCVPHYSGCGYGNTNRYARLYSRIHNAFGVVMTNAISQSYWNWNGSRSLCANVGGLMYDHIFIPGPDDATLRYEPRECGKGSGDHYLNEICPNGNRCPLQWFASTIVPNQHFKFWAATVGFHRLHYWFPGGSPIPSGAHHSFYHWVRAEHLVEPTKAFFSGIACGAGGTYGRGAPWFQYHTCVSVSG